MEAVKCDRCGIYFDKDPDIPRNAWHEEVSGFTVSLVISRKGNPSDLCPSCIEALTQEAIKQRENVRLLLE